jgi:hypothetical protein
MKRLVRDLHVNAVPQPRDEQYLYMPNPAIIPSRSTRINHFLAIVDFYIYVKHPSFFDVEPTIDEHYRPDARFRDGKENEWIVEVQLSRIKLSKMQDKVNNFVRTHREGKHGSRNMIIVSDNKYEVIVPDRYRVHHIPASQVKETTLVV